VQCLPAALALRGRPGLAALAWRPLPALCALAEHQAASGRRHSQRACIARISKGALLLQQHLKVLLLLQGLQLFLLLLHLLLALQVEAHLLLLLQLHHQLLLQLKRELLLLSRFALVLVLLRDAHDQLLQQSLLRSIQLMVLLRLRLCRLLWRWLLQTRLVQQLSKLQGRKEGGQTQNQ
jgi:hypothetical protein